MADLSRKTAEKEAKCRLGYIEYDGSRYCFAHGGFFQPGLSTRRCDRAPALPQRLATEDFDAMRLRRLKEHIARHPDRLLPVTSPAEETR